MNIATILRYMDMDSGRYFDKRQYIPDDYRILTNTYGIGLFPVMGEAAIRDAVAVCDGLFVPGSATNIDPTYYGGEPFDPPNIVDEYAFDAKLIRAFYEAHKPIFGICGGQQAINVFFGGTLGLVPNRENHFDKETHTHMINIAEGSFVHDVFGKPRALVNSHHSWWTKTVAPDFSVAATTDDGIVEAIEWRRADIYATQWHPEQTFHRGALLDPIEHKFFENFLKRCEEKR